MAKARDETLEHLRGKIRDIMNATSDTMIEGSCKDYPEYTHNTGIIYGLALAERELLDIDDMLYRNDDK